MYLLISDPRRRFNTYFFILRAISHHKILLEARAQPLGRGVRTLSKFVLITQFWTAFFMGGRFNSVTLQWKWLYQVLPFNCTPDWTIWSSKFQTKSGEGLTGPPPKTSAPLFLGLSPRFGLRPQISFASPSTFEAWSPPWLEVQTLSLYTIAYCIEGNCASLKFICWRIRSQYIIYTIRYEKKSFVSASLQINIHCENAA